MEAVGVKAPKGQMNAYSFFLQLCREEFQRKHPEESRVNLADFARKCSDRWKTMSEKEKRRFNQMAEQDSIRYSTELKTYNMNKQKREAVASETRGIPPAKKPRKKRKFKDPDAPKRSMSAFFWYCQDERTKVRGANPDFSVGDVAKELARRWADINPTLKVKYDELAEKDRQRYDQAKQDYAKRKNAEKSSKPISKEIIDSDDGESD